MKGKVIEISIFAIILFFMVIVRVFIGSYVEYQEGEKFFDAKDFERAAIHFDRSIHWYTPLNPYVKKSVEKLFTIASNYETHEREKALETYETLRSAIYSTRSFYTPYRYAIERADDKIAKLRAEMIQADENWPKKAEKPTADQILYNLKKDRAPSVFFSILASIGFLGWVLAGVFFILKIMTKDAFPKRAGLITGILFFVFYFMWVFGLANA